MGVDIYEALCYNDLGLRRPVIMMISFIGGPCDGERYDVLPKTEEFSFRARDNEKELVIYKRRYIAFNVKYPMNVFVHESMTDEQAKAHINKRYGSK